MMRKTDWPRLGTSWAARIVVRLAGFYGWTLYRVDRSKSSSSVYVKLRHGGVKLCLRISDHGSRSTRRLLRWCDHPYQIDRVFDWLAYGWRGQVALPCGEPAGLPGEQGGGDGPESPQAGEAKQIKQRRVVVGRSVGI